MGQSKPPCGVRVHSKAQKKLYKTHLAVPASGKNELGLKINSFFILLILLVRGFFFLLESQHMELIGLHHFIVAVKTSQ